MPEYVYALFEFVPENPDELHFQAGECIEVIEKDDVYSDGWWQVSPLRSAEPFRSILGPSCMASAFGGRERTGRRRVVSSG